MDLIHYDSTVVAIDEISLHEDIHALYLPVRATPNEPPAATCTTCGRFPNREALMGTANLKKNIIRIKQ